MSTFSPSHQRGLTLLEVLVVIGIMTLLVMTAITTLPQAKKNIDLDSFASDVESVLGKAKVQTLSGAGGEQYGVHFALDRVVLFTGTTYDSASTTNEVFLAPTTVEVVDINLAGGGSNVIFDKLIAETSQPGTVTLRLVSEPTTSRTVTIESTGAVGVE